MEVSNPRDDRAERNRGSAEVPLSTVIPRVGNFHLEQNTILDSFSCTTTPKIWFISRFCVFFSLGENTWVRCNFITQAKSVAISVWCARIAISKQVALSYTNLTKYMKMYIHVSCMQHKNSHQNIIQLEPQQKYHFGRSVT